MRNPLLARCEASSAICDSGVCPGESLIKIRNDVFNMLNSYTQSDGFRCNTSLPLTFRGHLPVGG
jgi:hypothetical protein